MHLGDSFSISKMRYLIRFVLCVSILRNILSLLCQFICNIVMSPEQNDSKRFLSTSISQEDCVCSDKNYINSTNIPSLFDSNLVSNIGDAPVDLLRLHTLYQPVGQTLRVDEALHTLQSFDALFSIVCSAGSAHSTTTSTTRLRALRQLVSVLPRRLQPLHFTMDIATAVSDTSAVSALATDFTASLDACFHQGLMGGDCITQLADRQSVSSRTILALSAITSYRHLDFYTRFSDELVALSTVVKSSHINRTKYQDQHHCNISSSDSFILHRIRQGLHVDPVSSRTTTGVEERGQPTDSTVATHIEDRVVCMVFSTSASHAHLQAIADTWARDCDGYLAFSNHSSRAVGAIDLRQLFPDDMPEESYHNMWLKTQLIWRVVAFSSLLEQYDWFFLGGDDLFLIVDNLRKLVRQLGSNHSGSLAPVYVGRVLKANKYLRFCSGGSGYLLSRSAVSLLVNALTVNASNTVETHHMTDEDSSNIRTIQNACMSGIQTSMEDLLVGNCLYHLGVTPASHYPTRGGGIGHSIIDSPLSNRVTEEATTESAQALDLHRIFHPVSPSSAVAADQLWYLSMAEQLVTGHDCCSSASVSFQDIKPPKYDMRCLYHSVHKTRLFT